MIPTVPVPTAWVTSSHGVVVGYRYLRSRLWKLIPATRKFKKNQCGRAGGGGPGTELERLHCHRPGPGAFVLGLSLELSFRFHQTHEKSLAKNVGTVLVATDMQYKQYTYLLNLKMHLLTLLTKKHFSLFKSKKYIAIFFITLFIERWKNSMWTTMLICVTSSVCFRMKMP